MFYSVMATLLHFLRSLAVILFTVFGLTLATLALLLGGLMALNVSPVSFMAAPLYGRLSNFFLIFGGGDRLEGMVAISLTFSVVAAILGAFGAYKRSQRSEWHLIASAAGKD